jgi:hypothetical protein
VKDPLGIDADPGGYLSPAPFALELPGKYVVLEFCAQDLAQLALE